MKRAWNFLEVAVGLILLGALALGLAAAFQALSGQGAAGTLARTPQGYPPPPTLVVPETPSTPVQGYPPLPVATSPFQTPQATMVIIDIGAITSAPSPTFVPTLVGPTCYIDLLNQFSLNLPAGWYADPPPSPDALAGGSVIYNYDPSKVAGFGGDAQFPPGGLKIQIGSNKLKANQSFQQWLSDLIAFDTSSEAPVALSAVKKVLTD